jgi:rhodanese-related sulfurtransferase
MFAFGTRMVNVTTSELQVRLGKGEKFTVIDVREPWEYAEGHIPRSVLRPLGQIHTWAAEFDKDQEVFLICRTGARSGQAYQFLQALGYRNVRNVGGGIITWRGAVER